MTSHFKELHLQSGRQIKDIELRTVRVDAYKGHYLLERSQYDHSWSVFFYPEGSELDVIRVQRGLLSLEDAKRAQLFHNIDRLKAAVIARMSV